MALGQMGNSSFDPMSIHEQPHSNSFFSSNSFKNIHDVITQVASASASKVESFSEVSEHGTSLLKLQQLFGSEFKVDEFETKFTLAQEKARRRGNLELSVAEARQKDQENGLRIIKDGEVMAGPLEREAALLFNLFIAEWYSLGQDLVEMVNLLPHPEVKEQLMLEINYLFGSG